MSNFSRVLFENEISIAFFVVVCFVTSNKLPVLGGELLVGGEKRVEVELVVAERAAIVQIAHVEDDAERVTKLSTQCELVIQI